MSRYIDADALIEYLKKMWGRFDEDDWYEAQAKDAMKDDIEIVNKQHTVDAVPVVRCSKCRMSFVADESTELYGAEAGKRYCASGRKVTDDFFCADGKRRE